MELLDREACYRVFQTHDARFDGRIFVGVTSTGIYCRPICPARTPKFSNCRYFASAAAAQEAGFRPCLRCRPETAPELAFWRGSSNTVSRAMKLIAEGALDESEAGVEALAERLGVGGRQLRRLFQQHLGASPIAVAQTRRVLFAKHLIHDTQLPMTEVALSAGFGSVRRFNEIFRKMFGRPPSALRRARRPDTSARDGVTLRLGYRPPYDWPGMLDALAQRANKRPEWIEGGAWHRRIELDGNKGTVAGRAPARAQFGRGDHPLPGRARPAGHRVAGEACVRPRRRHRHHQLAISPRIPSWRRWSPSGRACARPANGIAKRCPRSTPMRRQPGDPGMPTRRNISGSQIMAESLDFFIDRLATPIGELIVIADSEGRLRTIDWTDHEGRMKQLLDRYYGKGKYTLTPRRDPGGLTSAMRRYFKGDIGVLAACRSRPGARRSSRASGRRCAASRTARRSATASWRAASAGPRAVRAAGLANGQNPISIVVPCHRVIGSDGSLTGYGGGLDRKQWLLRHEGVKLAARAHERSRHPDRAQRRVHPLGAAIRHASLRRDPVRRLPQHQSGRLARRQGGLPQADRPAGEDPRPLPATTSTCG
jgi:AraC family transcriptional regulator of adaptative response / DNA-3-methyladenine glycosylase II